MTVLLGLAVAVFGGWSWSQRGHQESGFVGLSIAPGEDFAEVAERLDSLELVDRVELFTWYGKLRGADAVLEPGAHWLPRGASPERLLQLLTRKLNRPHLKVTVPEGWDSFQIAERLASQGICSAESFRAVVQDKALALRLVGQDSLEGYLYPATYDLLWDSEPTALAERFVDLAKERFDGVWARQTPSASHGLSNHELVILASVVQKEAGDTSEVPTIASVFFNRLEDPEFKPRRMLQSDPTAGYGCKLSDAPPSCAGYSGRITPALLRDPANRYNSYRQPGLPPTPIGNPSSEAVSGVLSAPKTPYYFFVAGRDGRHRFSASLAEHERAFDE